MAINPAFLTIMSDLGIVLNIFYCLNEVLHAFIDSISSEIYILILYLKHTLN